MGDVIRIVIADDHQVVRSGVRTLLSLYEDIEIVGEAKNGKEAVDLVSQVGPDVVLMDLKMPVMDGPTAIGEIASRSPEVGVIALTSLEDESMIRAALEAGAAGFLFKDADEHDLIDAIRTVSHGKSVIAPDALRVVVQREHTLDNVTLTAREMEILRLVAWGRTNRDIADRLGISVSTVNFHVHNILDKLDAKTRTEAVATAARDGLIDL